MSEISTSETPLLHFLRVLFRHKKKSLLAFLGMVGLATMAILFLPRTYESQAKLFVRIGRESVTLDPTATTGQTVMMQKTQETEINSILEIIGSRAITKAVVDRVGAEAILEIDRPANIVTRVVGEGIDMVGDILDSFSPANPAAEAVDEGLAEGLPSELEERAMRRVDQTTEVWAPKLSTVVTIMAKAGTPELARQVAQAKLDSFIDEHVRLNRTEGSFEFFDEQAAKYEVRLQQAQDDLQQKMTACKLLSVGGQRGILESKQRDIELAKLTTERELALSQAKLAELAKTVADLKTEIVMETVTGHANMGRDLMRDELFALEVKEQELLQRYTTSHPTMAAIHDQVKDTKRILAAQPAERTQEKSGLNPTRQALQLALEEQAANAVAWIAQRELLTQQFGQVQQELEQLNVQSVQIAALEREVQLAETNYRNHADKLEQARIDDALENQNISNVNIVQPASYVRKPAFPDKLLFLAGGILLGLMNALGITVLAEYLDSTLRTVEQTEAHLGIPVLMTIPPEISPSSYRAKGSRHVAR